MCLKQQKGETGTEMNKELLTPIIALSGSLVPDVCKYFQDIEYDIDKHHHKKHHVHKGPSCIYNLKLVCLCPYCRAVCVYYCIGWQVYSRSSKIAKQQDAEHGWYHVYYLVCPAVGTLFLLPKGSNQKHYQAGISDKSINNKLYYGNIGQCL